MSVVPTVTTYVTLDLLAWETDGSLELSPKFQRRPVWKSAARSYFVDTLLRGFPVPPIHVRLRLGPGNRAAREIVDGQQRLRTVFDFVSGKFALSRSLHGDWAGKDFSELSDEQRNTLMMYKFHGFQYEGVDDATILEIFARINTYSVQLNPQELRNGKFFGEFKTAMYDAARRHLAFWRSSGLFTETAIARMQEVEFTSELTIQLLDGLQDKKKSIDDFYRGLDEDWDSEKVVWKTKRGPQSIVYLDEDATRERLNSVLDEISGAVGDILSNSEFTRAPLFYSLFGAVAHRLYGLPRLEIHSPRRGLSRRAAVRLRGTVVDLSELLADKPTVDSLSGWQRDFVIASSRQTDNIQPRTTRLNTIWDHAGLER